MSIGFDIGDVPRSVVFDDAVENGKELSHGSNESDHFRFTCEDEALIEGADGRIVTDGHQGRHVKGTPHGCTSALNGTVAPKATRILIKRSDADQRGNLMTVEFAEFG